MFKTMKKWTDENTTILIKMYKQYPDLWRSNVKLKNPELRMNLWAHIAEVQETTADEVQKKIKALRRKFSIELKQYKDNPGVYFQNNPWKFFRQFMFLLKENEFKCSSAASESLMSESNCSSKQYGTEDSSTGPSKHQDESQDYAYSENCEENDVDEDQYDVPATKKKRFNGQQTALGDALQCIKILLDESDKRDEHSIYGEHIAHKLRSCNRSSNDIAIAQHHIENIVFNLSMGVYAQETADKNNLLLTPINASSVPDPFIIPKPDPSP